MQQRVATLRERAIAARDERIRAQKLEQWLDDARQAAEAEIKELQRGGRSVVSDERVQLVSELNEAFAQFDQIEALDPRHTAPWTDAEIESYYTSFGVERPTHYDDYDADNLSDDDDFEERVAARAMQIFIATFSDSEI